MSCEILIEIKLKSLLKASERVSIKVSFILNLVKNESKYLRLVP